MTEKTEGTKASGLTLVGWLRLFVVVSCMALIAALGLYEWSAKQALLNKAEAEATTLAGSVGQNAQDTFEIIDVLLTGAESRILASDRSLADIHAIDVALNDQLRQAWRVRSIMAFDEKGRQFISNQPQVQDWFDISDTNAFDVHRNRTGTSLLIGQPAKSPTNGDWIIPVSRRLTLRDGSFGGILVATVRVAYFANFYENLISRPGQVIALVSSEGTLLSRFPFIEEMIGHSGKPAFWQDHFAQSSGGVLRFRSPIDFVERVYGYKRVTDYPLVLFVGFSQSQVNAEWLSGAVVQIAGGVILTLILGALGMKLCKHVGLRQSSENELAKLARTDGLTGIMNRRSFDETFLKGCLRAGNSGQPLSLLLLDVDHFKAYNDTYGHQAGDASLQMVAKAMCATVYKPADRVARYGGEEFAVILPDTDQPSAVIVAERIRLAVVNLAIAHSGNADETVLTVSIGVSTWQTDSSSIEAVKEVLKDADRALYKAKLLGRNQVQSTVAPTSGRSERQLFAVNG